MQPLLACLHGVLKEAAPNLNTLGALDIEDHITGDCKKMWHDLVPAGKTSSPQAPTYIMQAAPAPGRAPQTTKKETSPEERWDLQQIYLF